MFIIWRTPSWYQCITVRTEKVGTKLTCCAYWRTKSQNCLIKNNSNLIQFLCRWKSKQNKWQKSRFCRKFFQPIVESKFKKHALFCESNAPLRIRMPILSPSVEFVSWEKTQNCPYVVYADLEAINVASTQIPRVKSRTKEIERQYAASFGAVLIDCRS